jgi:hypothetical protein
MHAFTIYVAFGFVIACERCLFGTLRAYAWGPRRVGIYGEDWEKHSICGTKWEKFT